MGVLEHHTIMFTSLTQMEQTCVTMTPRAVRARTLTKPDRGQASTRKVYRFRPTVMRKTKSNSGCGARWLLLSATMLLSLIALSMVLPSDMHARRRLSFLSPNQLPEAKVGDLVQGEAIYRAYQDGILKKIHFSNPQGNEHTKITCLEFPKFILVVTLVKGV